MKKEYRRLTYACYAVNVSMSVVAGLTPLLFLTFRNLYGISFSLLGALVLINFCTQLAVDLLLSFYSYRLNLAMMIRLTPILTACGLFLYAVLPVLFPGTAYLGLVIGTVIFSASGGLAEVLISPVIAALPSDNPEREMSRLHSVYAWGVVAVVLISTLFLYVCGRENWYWLVLLWTAVPLLSCFLFSGTAIPELKTPRSSSHTLSLLRQRSFLLCFFCIFLCGASECAMAQWSSSYLEEALRIPKLWGDMFGVALFAVMLGLGRTVYSKYGKNIYRVLVSSAAGATVCYLTAAISALPLLGLIACAMTGLCTAMLWPGSLIVATDKFPSAGIVVYALMAAGGDLGAALGPQMVGAMTDLAMASSRMQALAFSLGFSPEQLAMKVGLSAAALFPLLATVLFCVIYHQKQQKKAPSV